MDEEKKVEKTKTEKNTGKNLTYRNRKKKEKPYVKPTQVGRCGRH